MNLIDCHSHFDSNIKDIENVLYDMKSNNISKTALMSKITIEPLYIKSLFLMGIQRNLLQYDASRNLLKRLDKSFHKQKGGWNPWYRKILGNSKNYTILLNPDNKTIFDIVKKYPTKFFGWLFLNPSIQNCEEELNKYKSIENICGLKVHPFWHRYKIEKLKSVKSIARKYNLPIMIHLGFENKENIIRLIDNNSDINFILSHCAFPFYLNILNPLKEFKNVFVDLSSHHVDKKLVNDTVKLLGSKKCLFGVDDPYGGEKMAKTIIDWIKELPINHNSKEDIFFKNFINLYEKKL